MLVFWKARLVLLAVPKTGTTALEAALLPHADAAILNPPDKKHVTARRWRNQLAPFFENRGTRRMETMAVIREPLDWLGSWYRYRARPEIAGSETSTAGIGFDAFVEGWLSDPEPEFARVGRPSRFVSDGDGKIIVDHLFRYEALDKAVAFLEARLSVRLDLPRRNVSPKAPLALDPALEARLRREAAADFRLWEQLG
ncbi:gamma-glutamyl kinase [Roseicyclus persicicus]|uniref:Gamma-glutamyl kinase n=1 Tax=Roseicyclus persicicus TaxID=2650661 RepID=A0A7X6H153_9RHOB|nr:gamma-glutamyl kinase [Roseibacterium persicicum]NKX46098.1 gamma-glutamyl kinase [Roseibacterium persicicum]